MSEILESINEGALQESTFKCQKGVVLELRKVSRYIISDACEKIEIPKPPIVMIEEKGREEENPNDPNYQREVDEAVSKRGRLAIMIYVSFGTCVKDYAGIDPPESTQWAEELSDIGIEISDTPRSRYVEWLKYHVTSGFEFNDIIKAVTKYSGGTYEEDVKEAEESFPSTETRDSSE